MKNHFFLAIAISMGMLVGCGDSSSDSPTNPNTKDDYGSDISDKTGSVTAFFPAERSASDVVAWYATDVETESREGVTLTYVSAVYLFNDGSFIVTESQLRDSKGYHKGVVAEGGWSGSDYSNGIIEITMNGNKLPLEIKNGKFSINPDGEGDMHYTLMTSSVPKASDGGSSVEDNSKVVEESRNGTEEQLAKAKQLIQGSGAEAAEELTFDISEPEWEQIGVTYKAIYTITVSWSDEKFTIDSFGKSIGIGQYPVHAIGVQENSLPRSTNNNEWDILDYSSSEKSVTVTLSQKIDNLKIARVYVEGMYKGKVLTLYSLAFFIIPPGTEVEGYTSSPAASVPNDGGEISHGENDNLGEDEPGLNYSDALGPFFPVGYDQKNVTAWYLVEYEEDGEFPSQHVETVYLFKDGSLLVTKTRLKRGEISRRITATGTYTMEKEGDYLNNVITANVDDNGEVVTAEATIQDGELSVPFSSRSYNYVKEPATSLMSREPTE